MLRFICPLALPFSQAAAQVVEPWEHLEASLRGTKAWRAKLVKLDHSPPVIGQALAHERWLAKELNLIRVDQANTSLLLAEYGPSRATGLAVETKQSWLLSLADLHLGLDHVLLGSAAVEPLNNPELWAELLQEALEPTWELKPLLDPQERASYFVLSTPPLDWQASSSMQARGRNIEAYLPKGKDARAWRRAMNHMQMLLHEHPLNDKRREAGLQALNSLWLEGPVAHSQPLIACTLDQVNQTSQSQMQATCVIVKDWISPAQSADLQAWQTVWQQWVQSIAPIKQVQQWHFFGESTHLGIEVAPIDDWKIWRRQIGKALEGLRAAK